MSEYLAYLHAHPSIAFVQALAVLLAAFAVLWAVLEALARHIEEEHVRAEREAAGKCPGCGTSPDDENLSRP